MFKNPKTKAALIIALTFFVFPAWASCILKEGRVEKLKLAAEQFEAAPNFENAAQFFELVPDDFCEFNLIYGYSNGQAAPLYDSGLYEILPALQKFLEPGDLLKKYVSLAADAYWDADNVSILQYEYHQIFLSVPSEAIAMIQSLPEEQRHKAIRFLFDGPHPSNSFFNVEERALVCEINLDFCLELSVIENELLIEERQH